MKTTYYIELPDGQLANWFTRLRDAKAYGEKLFNEFKIVTVKGPYLCEGYHAKVREFKNGNYTTVKG